MIISAMRQQQIFLLLFLLGSSFCEDNICSRCDCSYSDDNNKLTLNCAHQSFKHVANWPEELPNEMVVSFSYNNITTLAQLPGTFAKLWISLDHAGIEFLDPGVFESTVNVTYVDLSYNQLTSAVLTPDVFKGPYSNQMYEPIQLRHLDLGYNQIHSLQKDVFEHTPYLEVLILAGNQLRVLDQVTQLAISSLNQLQVLNLTNNRLVDVPNDLVRNLKLLREVDLSQNRLDFVPETLDNVGGTLEKLNVDDNPIVELSDDTFTGFSNLQEVSLNNLTKLRNVRANTFAPLQKLKVLRLSNNELLEEIDREAFGPSQIIPEIYLNNNNLKALDYALLPWDKLTVFEIKGNNFYCSCDLYNISAALPREIKADEDGPYCLDIRTLTGRRVYDLQIDVCLDQPFGNSMRPSNIYDHFNLMRVSLVTLCVILAFSSIIALVLGWSRWKAHRRQSNYPFVSNIAYNPLQNVHM